MVICSYVCPMVRAHALLLGPCTHLGCTGMCVGQCSNGASRWQFLEWVAIILPSSLRIVPIAP